MPSRPVGPELAVDGVHGAPGDGEQPVVAERAMPGDGGLDEMADAVQLVAPREVAERLPAADDLDVAC